jgi:hypothetical protein
MGASRHCPRSGRPGRPPLQDRPAQPLTLVRRFGFQVRVSGWKVDSKPPPHVDAHCPLNQACNLLLQVMQKVAGDTVTVHGREWAGSGLESRLFAGLDSPPIRSGPDRFSDRKPIVFPAAQASGPRFQVVRFRVSGFDVWHFPLPDPYNPTAGNEPTGSLPVVQKIATGGIA